MLPNITNNERPALMVSVGFTLISFVAALSFFGMVAAATDIGRSNSTGARQGPIVLDDNFFTDNNFLASLRFWERNRSQSSARSSATVERNARPGDVSMETRNVTEEQSGNAASGRSASPGLAPTPPPISHSEHRGGFGNAFMPEWSASLHDAHERTAGQDMRSSTVSHVSYSLDARDWVELFSLRQEVREDTVQEGPLAAMRATSLHTLSPQTLIPRTEDGGEWDGQATQLATIASIREEINRLQQDQAAGPLPPSVEEPVERPPIDLTPSFTRRLPHVQTCGVVVVQANFPLTEIPRFSRKSTCCNMI